MFKWLLLRVTIKRNGVLDTQSLIGFLGVAAAVKEHVDSADVGIKFLPNI